MERRRIIERSGISFTPYIVSVVVSRMSGITVNVTSTQLYALLVSFYSFNSLNDYFIKKTIFITRFYIMTFFSYVILFLFALYWNKRLT